MFHLLLGKHRGRQLHSFSAVPDARPQEKRPQVLLYGARADLQLRRDLFVAAALDQQLQDLLIARCNLDLVQAQHGDSSFILIADIDRFYPVLTLVPGCDRNYTEAGNYPLTVGKDKPYVDYRLGGVARYSLTPRKDIDMHVPEEVLKCVVFIGREYGVSVKYIGTGFLVLLVETEGQHTFRFPYLVTANHVADAIDGAPFKIRVNNKSGEAVEIAANESGDVKWYRHPRGKEVDVAVCEWKMPAKAFDTLAVESTIFLTRELAEKTHIGVGDEVLITGLFSKITGKSKNVPIVRIGNLAMAPDEAIVPTALGNIEAYIIEAKSLGGISGSPVFIRQTADLVKAFHKWGTNEFVTIQAFTDVFHLLGLVHGHWKIDPAELNDPQVVHVDEGINVGLAIVVPASQILETLHHGELINMRRKAKDKALAEYQGSTMDSAAKPAFTKEDFDNALKKASRKVEPKKK
jgi:hypothetical protein